MTEIIRAFCIPGGHAGPVVGNMAEGAANPKGWRLLRAKKKGDKWVYDPQSPASIWVCPSFHRE